MDGAGIDLNRGDMLNMVKFTETSKDFRATLVRHVTSAEFAFLFMVSNPYVLYILNLITLKAKIFRTYDF